MTLNPSSPTDSDCYEVSFWCDSSRANARSQQRSYTVTLSECLFADELSMRASHTHQKRIIVWGIPSWHSNHAVCAATRLMSNGHISHYWVRITTIYKTKNCTKKNENKGSEWTGRGLGWCWTDSGSQTTRTPPPPDNQDIFLFQLISLWVDLREHF